MNPSPQWLRTPSIQALLIFYGRVFSLLIASVLLASVNVFATTNHPPTVSWIKDQALSDQPGQQHVFDTVYFGALDEGTPVTLANLSYAVENDPGTPNFYDDGAVHIDTCTGGDNGCPDGSFKVSFDEPQNGDGEATIVVTATDAGGAIGRSSFTLRKQSQAVFPPVLAGIPDEVIQKNSTLQYGPVWFVVDDLNSDGVDDALDSNGDYILPPPTARSDNHDVAEDSDVQFTALGGLRWSVTVKVKQNLSTTETTVITIVATDNQGFQTSTSFVLTVVVGSNTPPSFVSVPTPSPSPSGSYVEHNVTQNNSITYYFKVTDSETLDKSQLLVTATSSNANIVPNSPANLVCSTPNRTTGIGTVRITPLALPSPSPGAPQAATITLSVTDDAYTRREQFLYVAKNPAFPAFSFSRPIGVFNLDPDNTQHRPEDHFLTGEMRRMAWYDMEPSDNQFDFSKLDAAVATLLNAPGQVLSLNLVGEACYIAGDAQNTWCNTDIPDQQTACGTTCTLNGTPGVTRALPWDSILQGRRKRFLQQLSQHVIPATGNTVAKEPLIPIINCNLPGGDTGIRELNNVPFSPDTYVGYTREKLLGAVVTELRAIMTNFPGKLVHIGFFIVKDDQDDCCYNGTSLWYWLYPRLANQFNGIRAPRVHFFQEDLAAARLSAAPDYIPYLPPPDTMTTAYSFTPSHCELPSFAYPCGSNIDDCGPAGVCTSTLSPYNNGITFQANTPWSSPAMPNSNNDDKVTKTLNGTPSDAMEAAFNTYLNAYLEVYPPDLDHAQPPAGTPPPWDAPKWNAGLQSWKDYFYHLLSSTPLDAPAGLTVARGSATSNTVSWYGVYRATSYTLQTKSLSPPGSWANVSGCDPASTTCTDTASTSSRYAYRVQASNADGTLLSPWAQVAVFVSEPNYDGYVTVSNGTSMPVPNAAQPGIQAGQGITSNVSGFVSFDTGILTAGVTVLNAKLRLKQYANNAGFDALGPCVVDIRKGPYNNNEALEADDFDALETDMDVTPDVALTGVDSGNWVEAELDADYINDINTTDRTQFRLWFPQLQGAGEQIVGWYSGESTGSEPHLVVQYAGP
jgi:hypothetical protein